MKMISPALHLITKPVVLNAVRCTSSACKSADLSYLYREELKAKPPPGVGYYVYNRNPRNLEKLRLAYRNDGWHLESPGRTFWNKLSIKATPRHISCAVIHISEYVPITASTNELCFRRFFNSPSDRKACTFLARIFARRCLEAGINEMECFYTPVPNGKVDLIMKELENSGVSLKEAGRRIFPFDCKTKARPEMPWDVVIE